MAGTRWKLNLESYFSPAQLEKLNEIPASSSAAFPPDLPEKLDAPDGKLFDPMVIKFVLCVTDILRILHNYFPWETIQDIDNTEHYYHRVLWGHRDDDVTADMPKLKELSSILREEYDRCREVCYANSKRAAQPYYDLVDQLPSIKKDPSYKDLTTRSERYMIKQYLKQRGYQNGDGQSQTPQQSLASHLEVQLWKIIYSFLHFIYSYDCHISEVIYFLILRCCVRKYKI
ncbi:hypothetical protein MKW92_008482 [Papaver armeniacum]|nr:hypothetical protein MKW92_008482 [Papaver armeniacum]